MPVSRVMKLCDAQGDTQRAAEEREEQPANLTGVNREETGVTDLCLLCLESPTVGLRLGCGHAFCTQCVTDYTDDYHPPHAAENCHPPSDDKDSTKDPAEGDIKMGDQRGQDRHYLVCPTCLEALDMSDNKITPGDADQHAEDGSAHSVLVRGADSLHQSVNTVQPCDVCVFTTNTSSSKVNTAETEVHCSKCLLNLCAVCKEIHANHALFKSHPVVHIANKDSVAVYCDEHNNTQSHYFCDECARPCCSVCVLGSHSAHRSSTLLDALSARKDRIKLHLNVVLPALNKLGDKLKMLIAIAELHAHPSATTMITNAHARFGRSISEPVRHVHHSVVGDGQTEMSEIDSVQQPLLAHLNNNEINKSAGGGSTSGGGAKGTPKRKRSSVDTERVKKNGQYVSSLVHPPTAAATAAAPAAGGANGRGRKMSILDHFKSKKMSEPFTTKDTAYVELLAVTNGGAENSKDGTGSSTAPLPASSSPFYRRRRSRNPSNSSKKSSTSSVDAPWHQITRLGGLSPVLTRKSKLSTSMSSPCEKTASSPAPSETPAVAEADFSDENSPPLPVAVDEQPAAMMPMCDYRMLLQQEGLQPIPTDKLGRLQHKLDVLRKLCGHASRTFSARRFLDTCDDLEQRLRAATTVELPRLKADIKSLMEKHQALLQALNPALGGQHSAAGAVMPYPTASSQSSLEGAGSSAPIPRDSSEHDQLTSGGGGVNRNNTKLRRMRSLSDDAQLTLLVHPELVWKLERHAGGELWNRCGIAFLPDGRHIVVAEYDMNNMRNNRLHVYDEQGASVRVLCETQMCPLGVAVTPAGHIAVTDCKSKRVRIVSAETGAPIADFGKGQFGWPHGIAVNSRGQFVVSDAFNDTISVHSPDGKKLRQFGSSGSGNYCFRNPFHLAIDAHDNIIVSDCGNNCIKVFNADGDFLFCNRGVSSSSIEGAFDTNKNRRLKGPRGVAVDPKGNILVADDSSRVVMFDARGRYIRNVLTEEEHVGLSGEDHVKFVEGLALNAEGDLALTECNPTQMFAIKVFRLYKRP